MLDHRILIAYPNRIDSAILSGGSYVEAQPLANVQDRLIARVARSLDASPSSTLADIDFGRQRTIQVIALIAHTISTAGKWRIRASNVSDLSTTLYDVTDDVWTAIVGADWDIDELEWENNNYWAGSFTQEDTIGQTAIASRVLPEPISARYWKIEILDANNSAGFVDVGRYFMGDNFLNPIYNYDFGASLGYETDTAVEVSLGGAEFFDPREQVRVMRFTLSKLNDEEGFGRALELTRRAGIHGEMFVIADPLDEIYGPQRNMWGRLRQLSPLEQAIAIFDGNLNSMAFEIKEIR